MAIGQCMGRVPFLLRSDLIWRGGGGAGLCGGGGGGAGGGGGGGGGGLAF